LQGERKIYTQEELLEEAKETEAENQASLLILTAMEEEKKRLPQSSIFTKYN
jgi:hypothetical protein